MTFQQKLSEGMVTPAPWRPVKNYNQYLKCGRKFQHLDFLEAESHANNLRRKNNSEMPISVYMCDICGCLHVGRTKRYKHELLEGKFKFLTP